MSSHPQEDLEYLLSQKAEHEPRAVDSIPAEEKAKPSRSESGCDLPDFIRMTGELVDKTIKKKYKVNFMPDEGARPVVDSSLDLTEPMICFSVSSREPKMENKPRLREELKENSKDLRSDRFVSIYGQKFQCVVQFDIYASEYTTANAVMSAFEGMMLNYASFFKKNGVVELYFQKHFTDRNYDLFRNRVSVRSLRYYVEVERITPVFDGEIFDIEIH
jgi:hypothetical protein